MGQGQARLTRFCACRGLAVWPSDHVFATIQPGASAADVHCDRVVEEPAFVFAAHWLHNL